MNPDCRLKCLRRASPRTPDALSARRDQAKRVLRYRKTDRRPRCGVSEGTPGPPYRALIPRVDLCEVEPKWFEHSALVSHCLRRSCHFGLQNGFCKGKFGPTEACCQSNDGINAGRGNDRKDQCSLLRNDDQSDAYAYHFDESLCCNCDRFWRCQPDGQGLAALSPLPWECGHGGSACCNNRFQPTAFFLHRIHPSSCPLVFPTPLQHERSMRHGFDGGRYATAIFRGQSAPGRYGTTPIPTN